MDNLETFRKETHAWLEANCPPEMRRPVQGEEDACWGGRHPDFQSDAQRLWLERMAAKGWTVPEWPREYGGGGLTRDEAKILHQEMRALGCRQPLTSFGISMLGPALLNGDAGLSLIPAPLQGEFNPQSAGYEWGFAAVGLALALGVYLFLRRITESPYGRSLRAMRDNDLVADSLGKNLLSLRTAMLVLGGAIAGLSGGILVSYISTWSPAAWGYAETVVLFAAVIIGGAGNHRGAILGSILVPVGFEEVTRFIPTSNNLPPNLIPSLQWVAIGLLIVGFLWLRPQGIFPERKRVIGLAGAAPAGGAGAWGWRRKALAEVALPETPVAGGGAPADEVTVGWRSSAAADVAAPEAGAADGDGGQRDAHDAPRRPAPLAGEGPEGDGGTGVLGGGTRSQTAVVPSAAGEKGVVLEAVGVVRDFGGMRAVNDVSFQRS